MITIHRELFSLSYLFISLRISISLVAFIIYFSHYLKDQVKQRLSKLYKRYIRISDNSFKESLDKIIHTIKQMGRQCVQ